MAIAGYLQINSSMSVKSSLPWRSVLSLFSTGAEKARLASMLFPGSTTGQIESQPWPGSLRRPPSTLVQPVGRSPLSTHHRSAPSLPGPCPQRLRDWIQLSSILKGQGPPATLSICQARPPESRIRKERGANSSKPQLWAQSPTQKMKRQTFMWAVVTLK